MSETAEAGAAIHVPSERRAPPRAGRWRRSVVGPPASRREATNRLREPAACNAESAAPRPECPTRLDALADRARDELVDDDRLRPLIGGRSRQLLVPPAQRPGARMRSRPISDSGILVAVGDVTPIFASLSHMPSAGPNPTSPGKAPRQSSVAACARIPAPRRVYSLRASVVPAGPRVIVHSTRVGVMEWRSGTRASIAYRYV